MTTEGFSLVNSGKYSLVGFWKDQNGDLVRHLLKISNSKKEIERAFKKNKKHLFDRFSVFNEMGKLFDIPSVLR